ncbi:hypothetical protein QC763_0016360 [Podospora pseudopauciseta]|uniref:Uncharacterized protein n=2 Tax=Podospora TaxID=5144 RepID=A0ABR0HZY9_9PEZI|nr:hypothetical protein QC763_0016360 [Podospora pseudopauciseta]KAK4682165.1 hypothetical protein QC764_0016340 [Podospora pseudoanserina]
MSIFRQYRRRSSSTDTPSLRDHLKQLIRASRADILGYNTTLRRGNHVRRIDNPLRARFRHEGQAKTNTNLLLHRAPLLLHQRRRIILRRHVNIAHQLVENSPSRSDHAIVVRRRHTRAVRHSSDPPDPSRFAIQVKGFGKTDLAGEAKLDYTAASLPSWPWAGTGEDSELDTRGGDAE